MRTETKYAFSDAIITLISPPACVTSSARAETSLTARSKRVASPFEAFMLTEASITAIRCTVSSGLNASITGHAITNAQAIMVKTCNIKSNKSWNLLIGCLCLRNFKLCFQTYVLDTNRFW